MANIIDASLESLISGFGQILSSFTKDPSIWWLLAPIILFWLVIEIYFGRYKKERLGWNTALGNGLSMFWIVVISLKDLFNENLGLFSKEKLIFIVFISAYSIFIIFVSFTHRIKENLFFLIASPTMVYFLSLIAILWINNLLIISLWVALDLVMLYFIIIIIEFVIKKSIPSASEEKKHTELKLGRI